ncbi:UNVERIFIED_CONTAM: putative starch synthase 4, chloroplastic/amyloplastic [Sesamum radiatum]|uniref:starch synthase n=1 Tax=Sesamum radiatum TaxID=300843 RepID=A0AAW2RCF8_SESRA
MAIVVAASVPRLPLSPQIWKRKPKICKAATPSLLQVGKPQWYGGASDEFTISSELLLRIDSLVLNGVISSMEASDLRRLIIDARGSSADDLYGLNCKNDAEFLAELHHFSKNSKKVVYGIGVTFIQPVYYSSLFSHDKVYGYSNDFERFTYFSRASLDYLVKSGKKPDVLHVHNWHTSIIGPLFWDVFVSQGGVVYSNKVIIISSIHSKGRILSAFGHGLELTLDIHKEKLVFAPRGFDKSTWDPSCDNILPQSYSVDDMKGKSVCKVVLQRHLDLPEGASKILLKAIKYGAAPLPLHSADSRFRLFGDDDESTTFSQYISRTFANMSLGQAIDELVTCFSPLTKAENLFLDLSLIKCFK